MSVNNEKCINPWFGFFFIVLICIMIAAAIFFESKEIRRARRMRQHPVQKKAATQVNFPYSSGGDITGGDKLVF